MVCAEVFHIWSVLEAISKSFSIFWIKSKGLGGLILRSIRKSESFLKLIFYCIFVKLTLLKLKMKKKSQQTDDRQMNDGKNEVV